MHMWCPDGIGRESWDWGGQESVGWLTPYSPRESGKKPSPSALSYGTPVGICLMETFVLWKHCPMGIYIMEPLQKVYEAFMGNLIPKNVFDLINNRFSLVLEGIARIEKASGIRFPIAYVEPSLVLSSETNSFDYGILFARTIPVFSNNSVEVIILISAPLVAY